MPDWRDKSSGGRIIGKNHLSFMRFQLAALGRANPELTDVAPTQVDGLACQEVLGCNATALTEEYGTTGAAGLGLRLQASLFEDYFNGWLRSYEHLIPVRVDLSDLVQQLEWAKAPLIQQRGLEAARRLVADEQRDCYLLLSLLEWARLHYTKKLPVRKRSARAAGGPDTESDDQLPDLPRSRVLWHDSERLKVANQFIISGVL
ncbi:hypothetical protein K438DRAFT_1772400 [Mycena galopus ATCC 62051]|nr:hypothetical protein K438DRAFT_1772400 [Mycena galopus ATCC 62051]